MAVWIKYFTCHAAVWCPTSSTKIKNGRVSISIVQCFDFAFKIYIESAKNKIAGIYFRSAYRYCFIEFFVKVVLITFLIYFHQPFTTSKSKRTFRVTKPMNFVISTFLIISRYRWMMTYLFRYPSEILSYKLKSLTKHWVKWFLWSSFCNVKLWYVVNYCLGKS